MPDLTIPGGPERGKSISEASPATLKYWEDRLSRAIESNESRYPEKDKALVTAMRAQLAVGGGEAGAGKRRTTRTQTAPRAARAPIQDMPQAPASLARRDVNALTGAFRTPNEVMTMLREAADSTHLVTPQTSCGQLPPGCVISSSLVWIDANAETYGIPHKDADRRGLDKTALTKIANAAGISWDPMLTRRLDNGSDPHYCVFQAVAYVRNFDGTTRTETGTVEMDLRDGSDAARGASEKELPIMRKFITRHAESKAMNRVIRRLGIRTSYFRNELDKPFLVCRVMFTGHTDDPELKRLFAEKMFEAFHGGHRALYGRATARPAPALATFAPPALTPPNGLDDEGYGYEEDDDDVQPYAAENYDYDDGDTTFPPASANEPAQTELKT